MVEYLILNVVFLITVLLVFRIPVKKPTNSWWFTLSILLILTAIFDSLIIAFDIVAYDQTKILGVYIGKAPVEDFFYTILAVVLVPHLWSVFKPKGKEHVNNT